MLYVCKQMAKQLGYKVLEDSYGEGYYLEDSQEQQEFYEDIEDLHKKLSLLLQIL